VYWHLTADGAAQLDTYRPLEMTARLYEEDPRYC